MNTHSLVLYVCLSRGFGSPPTRLPRPTSRHDASPAHLKEKAQHAGYKAPVEKWDTDSDSSDGSGDELDLAV